jgi:transcriptional regulator with XRE-family HTH domain
MDLLSRRLRAKLSLAELARRAGCAASTLCNLEHGRTTASRDLWQRIDAALDPPPPLPEAAAPLPAAAAVSTRTEDMT